MKVKLYAFQVSIFLFLAISCKAQVENKYYKYEQLSSIAYKEYRDSLKKNWKCPTVFKSKSTQKEYEASWVNRKEQIITSIDNNSFIREELVYDYVHNIFKDLFSSNKELITFFPKFFIDRSEIANAYAFGDHIIVINLGIILRSQSREELAFYLAHELAHDILKHSDNSMRNRAELVTSDEYKESLKDILSSKYERFTKLKKVMEGYTFDRTRHSRYSESEADSLGIIIMKNSKMGFDATCFLNLDTMDKRYKIELVTPIKNHLQSIGIDADENLFTKKSKGLSSTGFKAKDSLYSNEDSLKTHPDCKNRFEKNKTLSTLNFKPTPIPADVKEAAFQISLFGMIVDNNLCRATYSLLKEKEKNADLKNYEQRFGDILNSLVYSTKKMNRFNALRIQKKENISNSYYQLQNYFEQIPESELNAICASFNKSDVVKENEYKKMLDFFSIISTDNTAEIKSKLPDFSKKFESSFPSSIYLEYIK